MLGAVTHGDPLARVDAELDMDGQTAERAEHDGLLSGAGGNTPAFRKHARHAPSYPQAGQFFGRFCARVDFHLFTLKLETSGGPQRWNAQGLKSAITLTLLFTLVGHRVRPAAGLRPRADFSRCCPLPQGRKARVRDRKFQPHAGCGFLRGGRYSGLRPSFPPPRPVRPSAASPPRPHGVAPVKRRRRLGFAVSLVAAPHAAHF